jgi:hypothetical protein
MIYTVQSDLGTHLAIATKNKRGPATITFFPAAGLTASMRAELAKGVRAKLRLFKAQRAAPVLTAAAPAAMQCVRGGF